MRTRVGRLGLMEILAIIELRTTPDSAWIVELGAVFDCSVTRITSGDQHHI